MDKYYYFVSQLPLLTFDKETYLTRIDFLAEASKWLSAKELDNLSSVDLNNFKVKLEDSFLLKSYKEFEKGLRQSLVLIRRPQEARSGEQIEEEVKEATSLKSPLEVEKRLLYMRWKFLEGLSFGHYFDLEFLRAYYLKLQMLERLFTFDKSKGTVVFDKLSEVNID